MQPVLIIVVLTMVRSIVISGSPMQPCCSPSICSLYLHTTGILTCVACIRLSAVAGSPVDLDQFSSNVHRAHTASYTVDTHTAPPATQPSHSASSSSRRAGSGAADMLLAAIQTTRQRAHGSQRPKGGRSRQVNLRPAVMLSYYCPQSAAISSILA